MRCVNERFKPQSIRSCRQPVIEKTLETTIAIGTPCVMWVTMHFFISTAGGASPLAMQKTQPHSSLLSRFDDFLYGFVSRDDTM